MATSELKRAERVTVRFRAHELAVVTAAAELSCERVAEFGRTAAIRWAEHVLRFADCAGDSAAE